AANSRPATALLREMLSGHDNDITALQNDVLVEFAAAHDLVVCERQGRLVAVRSAPEDADAAGIGKCRQPAGHAERLHDIDAGIDDELAGIVHLPDDVDLVAVDLGE